MQDGEGESSEAASLLSYTLRYVSFAELAHMCQFGFREPMNLCVYVSEEGEGGDGEGPVSEAPSLMSYTRRYVSFAELGHVCQFGLREPMHLCACVSAGSTRILQRIAGNVSFCVSLRISFSSTFAPGF